MDQAAKAASAVFLRSNSQVSVADTELAAVAVQVQMPTPARTATKASLL